MRDHWFYIQRWRHNRHLKEQEQKRKEETNAMGRSQDKKTTS